MTSLETGGKPFPRSDSRSEETKFLHECQVSTCIHLDMAEYTDSSLIDTRKGFVRQIQTLT